MVRPEKGRALFYTRDSGGRHEMTPAQYVLWARKKAQEIGLSFNGTPDAIEALIATGRSHQDDIFLDYDVAGNQLSRAGLSQLMAEVAADQSITHVFIPRRDRIARPDDPLTAMVLEATLSRMGVTLVFMDRVVPPLARGQRQDISELLVGLIDYHQAGKDRQELARKILFAQLALAKAGYSIGGRPPYGFCRWLVREDGSRVRQLAEGERVRMRGHHVVWLPLPDDHPHVAVIRRILEMLQTMPACRVAAILTAEGVPSPDAGRSRKDNGVRHQVSGVWHQTSIMNIARNPLLLAVCSSGRRSMGDQLRHAPDGPRALNDSDFRHDSGKPKVVQNPESSRIVAKAHFESPLVDPDEHRRLQQILDERAGTQRGKPRSRNPNVNPLGGRVFDMNCGWPMYREPYSSSFRYKCGAYTQSHGLQCSHNHVGGEMVTRFALSCLVQKVLSPRLVDKLEARLYELARKELGSQQPATEINTARDTALERLSEDLATAKRNLALAKSEAQYKAVAEIFDELTKKKQELEAEIAAAQRVGKSGSNPDTEVAAALAVLKRLPDLANDPKNLAAVGEAFRLVNLRLFLSFRPEQIKKRLLNKVAGGIVAFGTAPAPIELYTGPTGRRYLQASSATTVAAGPGGDVPLPDQIDPGREGNSLGNVNRGDSIWSLLHETSGLRLALGVFPQNLEFQGDAIAKYVEPGLYSKRGPSSA